MHRNWIVHGGLDTVSTQNLLQPLPPRAAYRIDVVNMAGIRHLHRRAYGASPPQRGVKLCMTDTRLVPSRQMPQLHTQTSALDAFHAVVVSLEPVIVLPLGSPIAQHAYGPIELRIVSDNSAPLSASAEILAGVEAETRHVAQTASRPPLIFRAVRLRRIFNHQQFPAAGYLQDRVPVRRVSLQMYRDDRPSLLCDARFNHRWIPIERRRMGVPLNRLCAAL